MAIKIRTQIWKTPQDDKEARVQNITAIKNRLVEISSESPKTAPRTFKLNCKVCKLVPYLRRNHRLKANFQSNCLMLLGKVTSKSKVLPTIRVL